MGHPGSRLTAVLCLTASLALAGCSLSSTAPASVTTSTLGAIRGNIHGGQQPVKNAHVYLFAAGNTGYGGYGIDPSDANTSISLLRPAITGHTDADSRGYVVTDDGGGFTITGDYICTAGQQVYLYAVGGNPGSGPNSAAGFLAILGTCPDATSFPSTTFIQMNEVTTVAAAFAFAGFASDATHVSGSNTALSKTGIANAFANAANLADITTGSALATTPHGNGTVPQTEINSLANILAACVNASNDVPGQCPALLANALSNGPTVSIPNDTATAAINIAHSPANAVSTIFDLSTGIGAPFAPALPATPVPNDFTISLQFTGGINDPSGIAIDSSGNAWIANTFAGGSAAKLSSTGVRAPGSPFTSGFSYPGPLAIDSNDRPWFGIQPGIRTGGITELDTSGSLIGIYSGDEIQTPQGIAFTGNGDFWVTNYEVSQVDKYTPAGVSHDGDLLLTPDGTFPAPLNTSAVAIDASENAWVTGPSSVIIFSPLGDVLASPQINSVQGVAIDSSGNGWSTSSSPSAIYKISKSAPFSKSIYTDDSLSQPMGIAIDGADNIWVANNTSTVLPTVAEFSDAGLPLSGPTGYKIAMPKPQYIAIDGSGDVWVATSYAIPVDLGLPIPMTYVTEIIGAATPVVTPLVAGVTNNTIATRP